MDRFDAMLVVVAVAEKGSLSAAARHLDMPLPTVSRKVSDLEVHLNTRLFNRSTRRLVLTDAGTDYVAACKQILAEVTDAEQAAGGEFAAPTGDMVISAPILFGRLHVLPTIAEFLRKYPKIFIRMVQTDRVVNLIEDQVDLAVRIGELADNRLIATRCGMVRQVVCASPAYLAENGTPKRPADLSNHDLVSFEAVTSNEQWTFELDRSPLQVSIRPRLIVNTAEAAIDAALAGVGLTRLFSYQVQSAVKTGALIPVLRRFESALTPVSMIYSSQRRLPLKVRAFLDFAGPRLRAALA